MIDLLARRSHIFRQRHAVPRLRNVLGPVVEELGRPRELPLLKLDEMRGGVELVSVALAEGAVGSLQAVDSRTEPRGERSEEGRGEDPEEQHPFSSSLLTLKLGELLPGAIWVLVNEGIVLAPVCIL